jgi:2-methylaconitate cis-trans-isomerase PrpF
MSRVIPCVLMRAGTSRGPFFLNTWLPTDETARNNLLMDAIGAADKLQLNGVGGGNTLTSKVAIVSRSSQPDCDVDYLFAQVAVGKRSVDTRPNCGNMLAGVGPFAIEQGLVAANDGTTTVRIYNVNTRSKVNAVVQTPNRQVRYSGDTTIDGVVAPAAPIALNFLDAWGAVTGKVFPTGNRIDTLQGTPLTCIDAAMPLMIIHASALGLSGNESPAELDANRALLQRLESLRLEAGMRMGLGDVRDSVIPKPAIVSGNLTQDPQHARITSRYFTPHQCHASHAVTGAIAIATAYALPGTVASRSLAFDGVRTPEQVIHVDHPAGQIEVAASFSGSGADMAITSAALLRTVRKIMVGQLFLD